MAIYKDAEPGKHGYISEIDEFLLNFHQSRSSISDSAQKEIQKHNEIAHKRDNPEPADNNRIWEDF